MSSMIERLSEIEETAEAIVEHAEEEKHEIEKKIQAKRDAFDRDKVERIRAEANSKMEQILEEQRQKNAATIEAMKRDFEEHHNVYAREILKHMVEV